MNTYITCWWLKWSTKAHRKVKILQRSIKLLCRHQRTNSHVRNLPCFIITVRNLIMTFDDGLKRTCLFPRFSALLIDFNASLNTFIRTIAVIKGAIFISKQEYRLHKQSGWQLRSAAFNSFTTNGELVVYMKYRLFKNLQPCVTVLIYH